MERSNRELVTRFWATMETNEWADVAPLLHSDFHLEYPQSQERLRGLENFVAVNAEYPAAGRWHFEVKRLIADDTGVVTEVDVTEGSLEATVISFFELVDGRISRMVEYWPDPFPAAPNRAHLVGVI